MRDAQRRRSRRPAHRVPHRHQPWRRHRRGRRHLRRRASTSPRGWKAWPKPGGVAVSSAVRDNIGNKLDLVFEDMGEHDAQEYRLSGAGLRCRHRRAVRSCRRPRPSANADGERKAVDRGPAVQQHERRPGAGIFLRRHRRGHHHRPEQDFAACSSSAATPASPTRAGRCSCSRSRPSSGVKFLLEGSVRKAGNRVRVTGQLIDGTHRRPSCGPTATTATSTDIFAIQDEITNSIVDQLKIRLLPGRRRRSSARRPTMSRPIITISRAGSCSTPSPSPI